MKPFDYLSVLFSIVISLGITHVLVGIAHMIRVGVQRFSIPLAWWIAYVLFMCVDYWFSLWQLHEQEVWSLGYVLYLLASAAIIFVTARLVVPGDKTEEPVDMAAFYDRYRRKIIAVLIFGLFESQIMNITAPGFGGLLIWLMVAAYLASYLLAYFVNRPWAQLAAAAGAAATTSWYVAMYLTEL